MSSHVVTYVSGLYTLSIPNTTHLLEGKFGDMKRLLKCHHRLKKVNKMLSINDYSAKE